MATAKLKRKPRLSKFESYKAAHTKKVWFRLKFCVVFAHRYIYPAAAARRSGRTCRMSAMMSALLGAWVLVNAKALGPQEGS